MALMKVKPFIGTDEAGKAYDRAILEERKRKARLTKTCAECSRVFDLTNEIDAEEFYYGHDCESN